jgi:curved DNA-binding protein CbpA
MRSRNGLYTLLQVLPDADPAVIEAAYKALMKKHHPDRLGGVDAERRAAEISHAFNVLRDPDRRADYDADERAREERYKVELSRVFPEPAPSRGTAPPIASPPGSARPASSPSPPPSPCLRAAHRTPRPRSRFPRR